jgi:hypothetical protein
MKNNKLKTILCAAVFLPLLVTSAWATNLKTSDGQTVESKSFPFIKKRQSLQNYLQNGYHRGSFGLAVSGRVCLTTWFSSWGSGDPVSRSIDKCNKRLEQNLVDYPQKVRSNCSCVSVIKDFDVVRDDILDYPYYKGIIKIFIKSKAEKLETVRGFLEFEKLGLSKQKVRFFNGENQEVCKGEMEFSTGDGSFNLDCFGESLKASGIATVKTGVFTKTHSIGSGLLSNGSVFAFITTFTDREIVEKYPNYPLVEVNDEPHDDTFIEQE